MTDIQVFNNPEFGSIRSLEQNGEPWFVGKDVAEALGYGNPQRAIRDHVDALDKGVTEMVTPGGKQQMPIINESGLYSLIFSSKLEGAQRFKRWVTSEVLPSIRKHGAYIAGQEQLTNEELLAKALVVTHRILEERDARLAAQDARISELTVANQIAAPKAEYFDELVDRRLLTSFRDTSKQLEVGEKVFIGFLLEHKYIYRDKKGHLMPYADKNDGLFEVKEGVNRKTAWAGTQTLITPKGRETFRLMLPKMLATEAQRKPKKRK
jgi:prophage antirepressor-like protein